MRSAIVVSPKNASTSTRTRRRVRGGDHVTEADSEEADTRVVDRLEQRVERLDAIAKAPPDQAPADHLRGHPEDEEGEQ